MKRFGGRSRRMTSLRMVMAVALIGMMSMMQAEASNLDEASIISPLDKCDFHFQGHKSVPPILNLQDPAAFSSSIVTRQGQPVVTAATGKECEFPGNDGGQLSAEMAAVCADHFRMALDKLVTTAVANVTDWLKGRFITLPLTAVDLLDGTQLRAGDGNTTFPESRRCVAFFTASDVISVLDKMLNKDHRKKLAKVTVSAQRFRWDFNALLNNILQFPQ